MFGQPRRRIGRPNVDRVPRYVSRRFRRRDPPGSFLFGAVLQDRLAEEVFLVLRGTPAAVDVEGDPIARGIGRSVAHGAEERWIKLGDTRNLVIEDRRAARDGTLGLANRIPVLVAVDEDV